MTAPTEPLTFEEALAKAHELELSVHFQRDGHVEITTLSDDDLAYGLGLLRTLSKALGRPVVARDPAAELRAALHGLLEAVERRFMGPTMDGGHIPPSMRKAWNAARAALAATEGEA